MAEFLKITLRSTNRFRFAVEHEAKVVKIPKYERFSWLGWIPSCST